MGEVTTADVCGCSLNSTHFLGTLTHRSLLTQYIKREAIAAESFVYPLTGSLFSTQLQHLLAPWIRPIETECRISQIGSS